MRSVLFSIFLFSLIKFGFSGWGTPPEGWDDFDFGVLDSKREPFTSALAAAVDEGIRIDHRYVYITTLADIEGFLFASWYNYATDGPNGIRPSVTIYMLQQGQDAADGSSALNSAADATYMKQYFEGVKKIAQECAGTKPIFVLEPDVWGYLLGQANPSLTEVNLSKICHINDLGLSWLTEFENRMDNLPAALIKTLKLYAPDCYTGVLMAHWGFPHDIEGAKADGKLSGQYIKKFLKEPYRGDFIGIEKNGTGAGYKLFGDELYWDDATNEAYLAWCKELGMEVDLPIFGWQISFGYVNEPGYDPLPNTNYRWEDTYFQYFFNHVDDFINAGFIGFDAGCNDRGLGTCASVTVGEGDNRHLYNNLIEFNKNRPYNLNIVESPITESQKDIAKNACVCKISSNRLVINEDVIKNNNMVEISLFNSKGQLISELFKGNSGMLKSGIKLNKNSDLSIGAYWISIKGSGLNSQIPYIISK